MQRLELENVYQKKKRQKDSSNKNYVFEKNFHVL